MESYLKETLRKLNSGDDYPWIVVSGNEACDLDSTACALAYAFFKQQQVGDKALVIPLCHIHRADMCLRTEVVHWLNHCHIRPDLLIYVDELFRPGRAAPISNVQLILVDHNAATGKLASMHWPVIEIIDHHQMESADDQQLSKCQLKRIERVGSCASLVTELLLQNDLSDSLPPVLWELLYGAILIDTIGVSVRGQKAGRLTDLDLLMATRIEDRIGCRIFTTGVTRESLFSELEEAKFNVKDLSIWDLLRRDTKLAYGPEGREDRFVCSTVSGLDMVDLIRAPDFVKMANRLCTLHSASLAVCITVGYAPTSASASSSSSSPQTEIVQSAKERRKGLIIYSPKSQKNFCKELVQYMCDPAHMLNLRPEPVEQSVVEFIGVIHNPTVTRKAILPVLTRFLLRHTYPPSGGTGTGGSIAPTRDLDSNPTNPDSKSSTSSSYPIRSLDPAIQQELDYLRSWLASFDPKRRFEVVRTTVSNVMEKLSTEHPSVELLKQVAIQLTEQARADRKFEEKLNELGLSSIAGKPGVLSDIGKALNRGRRSTLPATNELSAYQAAKQKQKASKKFRGSSDDSYSLPDQENTKPSWLETEYLTRLRSWLPDHIPISSAEGVEGVSYRLYRRLSSIPPDCRLKSPDFSASEFESGDENYSEAPMDDAELALLRTSFADIQVLSSSLNTDDEVCAEAESNQQMPPCTSWPLTPQDSVVQRGLEWLRRGSNIRRPSCHSTFGHPSATEHSSGLHFLHTSARNSRRFSHDVVIGRYPRGTEHIESARLTSSNPRSRHFHAEHGSQASGRFKRPSEPSHSRRCD